MVDVPKDAVEALVNPRDKALEKHGITIDWWLGEMKGFAENAVITKTATREGTITDEREYADNRIRIDAMKEIGNVAQFYPKQQMDVSGSLQLGPPMTPEQWAEMREVSLKVVDAIISRNIRDTA